MTSETLGEGTIQRRMQGELQKPDRYMKVRFGRNGAHLFDRHSGVNILLDDVAVDEAVWSKAPRYVSLSLANACDLHCSFCYASKEPRRLDYDTVTAWAKELDLNGCLGIGFGGGEPTLYPRFVELCRELHATTNLALTMTTHGHRFTPELADGLRGALSFIRVSMDGVGTTYERIRGRPFWQFVDRLNVVRSIAPFGINYVVNADTLGDLTRAAAFAFSSGAVELLLLPETGTDGNIRVDADVLRGLEDWVFENHDRYRVAISAHGADAIKAEALTPFNEEESSYAFLHIDASGTLKESTFTRKGIEIAEHSCLLDAITTLRHAA